MEYIVRNDDPSNMKQRDKDWVNEVANEEDNEEHFEWLPEKVLSGQMLP